MRLNSDNPKEDSPLLLLSPLFWLSRLCNLPSWLV